MNNEKNEEQPQQEKGARIDTQELNKHLLEYLKEFHGLTNAREAFKCLNPDHPDKHPSMSYDPKRCIAHCFSCGKTYTLIDLVMQDKGISAGDAIRWLAEKYQGVQLPKSAMTQQKANDADPCAFLDKLGNNEAVAYLTQERGFKHAKELCQAFHIKSNALWAYFPHYGLSGGQYKPTDYQARSLNPLAPHKERFKRAKGTPTSIYDNFQALTMKREGLNLVAIVEGEIDSLSIFDLTADAPEDLKGLMPIALSGVGMNLLEDALSAIDEKDRPDYGFILALDNDEAGEIASLSAQAILEKLGFRFTTKSFYSTYKDANERLQKDRAGMLKDLEDIKQNFDALSKGEKTASEKEEADYIAKNSATNALEGLICDINEPSETNPIKTNFQALDTILGGEINKGIMTIGALSSLGKTSLVLQIADQVAMEGKRDILYFTLEMSKKELVAKSLSRITYLDAYEKSQVGTLARNTAGIMSARRYATYTQAQQDEISLAFDTYRQYSNRLFFIAPKDSGSMSALDIEQAIMEHIKVTKRKPIVIIDYLQIMKPMRDRTDTRQALDENFSALKRVSAREGLAIILISSVSRANYNTPIDMASFKDSGGIEYSSDYLLGLDLDIFYKAKEQGGIEGLDPNKNATEIREAVRTAKAHNPRKVVLTILKNRNGETDKQATFNYYPAFNTFVETDKDEEDTGALIKMLDSVKGIALTDDDLPF
jgi:replicative DNA helicase